MTLLLITLTLFSLPPDGAALFEESNTAYHEGQYTDAIAGYEKLQHQFDVKNAALFFNLGNAWRKNGNPGKAILYYEMALAMDQRFAPARANMERCLENTKRNLPALDPRQLNPHSLIRYYPLSPMQSLFLTHSFLLLALLLLAVRYWKETPRLIRFSRIVLILAMIFFAITVSVNYTSESSPKQAVALSEEIPVYFSMNAMDSPRFFLYEGDRVLIDRIEKEWVRVNTYGGERGWTKKSGVGIVELLMRE